MIIISILLKNSFIKEKNFSELIIQKKKNYNIIEKND
jgi:hypothetical protein